METGGCANRPGFELEDWAPPCKKQCAEGELCRLLPLINEDETVITDAKVLLHHHHPELVQYIKLEAILPYLNKYHLLTDSENDDLLNVVLSERIRVLKLIHFIEGKGPEGFQRFLTALAEEPDHLGHKELAQLFSPYHIRTALPNL